ncbi:MAG: hypothetical protein CO103_08500 [Chloroflexi bacterium CG_4_9_14_3_um_filter_45_9]|nr:MAG: hypothetical protein AUK00_05460 [Dehalococcoidia bacterium CG2_30_46_9]PIX27176.1 MAG: hypothetical protein COZ67_03760 [Chloroflexi bacterium CG_4_8_14_3_um_filter_45_15]PJB47396.1 MAG: hypothetical protein CO103_08500 [Chloroflexi bacterium CG_4_9_14_3_um_filter_45_9]
MDGPLKGIKILALENFIAGPFGSMILADLGAEVIKIEPPEGDASRTFAGPKYKGETYYFMALNRSKKSLTLDLGTPLGKEAFYDLVKISDIVWDNYRPGVMERLGADFETLKKINPRIICSSIAGYGSSGPYRDWPSYDIIGLGLSGILSVTGEPGGPPIKPGPAIGDLTAAIFAALGVCAALAARERTGEGQKVEVSLLDACIALMAYHLSYYFCSGDIPRAEGSKHLSIVPFGAYPTKDSYITLGVCWPRVCRTLNAEWMIDDPRFSTQDARWKHRQECDEIISNILRQATTEQWMELMRLDDVAAGPVNTTDKVATDLQVLHNKMILEVEHPLGGKIKLAGNPIKMPTIKEEYLPPPTLGQHNNEILARLLGYSEGKIKKLKEQEEKNAQSRLAHIRKER